MHTPKKIAVIGFGEAGSIVADGCISGAKKLGQSLECHAWDIRMADPEQKRKLQMTAESFGVVLHDTTGDWLGDMDAVFSLVFGDAAKQVALDMLPFLGGGSTYIDLTTALPPDMRDAEAAFINNNAGFIDGTALGSFRTNGATVPFVLSGRDAVECSDWMNGLGFVTRPIAEEAGKASMVKLLRSCLAKGLEALAVECFVAADNMKLRDAMLEAFDDFNAVPLIKTLEAMSCSHIPHCKRRLAEVEHALGVLREAHVEPTMTYATEAFYARTVRSKRTLPSGAKEDWDDTLPVLSDILEPAGRNSAP